MQSLFDSYRLLGGVALAVSKDWLKHPTRIAEGFACGVVESHTSLKWDDLNEGLKQSLRVNALFAGRWAMSGFPTVTLGHRTAASFCMTKMRADDARDFLRAPWPAFAIRIPPGLLTVDSDGELADATLLMATCVNSTLLPTEENSPSEERWWWKLCAVPSRYPDGVREIVENVPLMNALTGGVNLWGFNQDSAHLARADGGASDEDFTRWDDSETTQESDLRSDQMARSMLIACCMYLSGDPRERAERASEGGITVRERKSKKRESDELPQYNEFELTSAIKINLHHTVRDYVRHGGKIPSVQTYVHGHWKRVAIGAGRAQRKLVHIQPYWRGDPNAPISTRAR